MSLSEEWYVVTLPNQDGDGDTMDTKERHMTSTLNLDTLTLKAGKHGTPDEGACLLEAVSFIAGEPWSDSPSCVSPVIAAFGRSWNDTLPDADRTRLLKPFIPRLVGTNTGPADDDTRAWMCLDWLVRDYTPAWLRAAGLDAQADLLVGLPEFKAGMDVPSVKPVIEGVRKDAAAAWAAARAAAWDAAWDAARDAAGAAAWDAAGAAARDAARAAAWAAAWDAAGAAAWDALEPTKVALQESAAGLLDRMIAVGQDIVA